MSGPTPRAAGPAFAAGLGTALAIALPLSLIVQILDSTLDDGLPDTVGTVFAVLMMVGPVAGGVVLGRCHRAASRWPLSFALGAAALGLVASLGAVRAAAGDDTDVPAGVVVGLTVWGGALGAGGAAAAGLGAARTRP